MATCEGTKPTGELCRSPSDVEEYMSEEAFAGKIPYCYKCALRYFQIDRKHKASTIWLRTVECELLPRTADMLFAQNHNTLAAIGPTVQSTH